MSTSTRSYTSAPVTQPVPVSLFAENRARLVARLAPATGILLVKGGEQKEQYDTDREVLFRQESNFYWLTGCHDPDAMFAMDVATGESTIFIKHLPEAYAVWYGTIESPETAAKRLGIQHGQYTKDLPHWFKGKKPSTIHVLKGTNSDSGNEVEAATFEGISEFSLDTSKAYPALEACRVYKSDEEIKILRYANKVSSNAHIEVMRSVKPGMTEFQVESLFLHAVYGKGQCRHVAYTCICAAGPSGALLHYPTNDKLVRDGQMMLLDMGGEYSCYASDITTSFPANGKFTEDQKAIYNAVLEANRAVQAAMKPGVNWVAMHELAYKVIAEHLLRIGICRGATAQELVDRDVVGLFMPHGLGHLMGHNVHDVGGYPAGSPARPTRIGFKSLRTARDLEERMVITVEPGIYFVKALLEPALANPEVSKYLDKAVLDRFMSFGGVRIEDDVLVTKTGVDNLTHVPRSVEDIEAVMAGGSWDIGAWNF